MTLSRSKPISPAPWKQKVKPSAKADPITSEDRALIRARSHGVCECCGAEHGTHAHHRQLRRHGRHDVTNLLWVCASCHRRIHGHPEYAYDQGLMVSAHDDPALIPVAVHLASWRLLLPDGSYRMDVA